MTMTTTNAAGRGPAKMSTEEKIGRGTCTVEGGSRHAHSCRKTAVALYRNAKTGYVALRCLWHDRFQRMQLENNGFAREEFRPHGKKADRALAPRDEVGRRIAAEPPPSAGRRR